MGIPNYGMKKPSPSLEKYRVVTTTRCQVCSEESDVLVGEKQTPLCRQHDEMSRTLAGVPLNG